MTLKITVFYTNGKREEYTANSYDMEYIRKNCMTNPLFSKTVLTTICDGIIWVDEIQL